MKLRKNELGFYEATFKTAAGKTKTISTKCTDRKEAEHVVRESGLKNLELAAKAGRLSREAIGHIVTGKKLTTEKAVGTYLQWMETVGKAPKSVVNTRATLLRWVKDMKVGSLPPSAITEDHINPWINDEDSDTKAGTRAVKLSHIVSLFEFCCVKGWTVGNPARLVRVRYDILSHEQKEPTEKQVFTPLEIKRIIADCEKKDRRFWNFATRISNEIGLRLGDICQLEWYCFKNPGKVIVWTDKRDKRVAVPVSEELVELLTTIPVSDPRYIFPAQQASTEDVDKRSALSMQYKRICEGLGIIGKSFHCLRHTCITRWAKEGKSLESIGEDVGHSDPETTKGYIH